MSKKVLVQSATPGSEKKFSWCYCIIEMAGFGGAIKNQAMGGAPAAVKKEQHAANERGS